jgi:hypothetical protein
LLSPLSCFQLESAMKVRWEKNDNVPPAGDGFEPETWG